ncbi:unnamed protein product [Pleuronectes platessa]|uniref:Uncharacterized protein n=1 Tax=Pleuronectes platessa TaxID=8262 RepID=A0A9N7VIY1_PLEPL|nr:unnamed protein product [Pleuronectes platessa]
MEVFNHPRPKMSVCDRYQDVSQSVSVAFSTLCQSLPRTEPGQQEIRNGSNKPRHKGTSCLQSTGFTWKEECFMCHVKFSCRKDGSIQSSQPLPGEVITLCAVSWVLEPVDRAAFCPGVGGKQIQRKHVCLSRQSL